MSKIVTGSFELMKQLNIAAILDIVHKHGRISRADIAKITGLTPASVTNITKYLIDRGYLVECGVGTSSGGRPPIIVELNENSRYILGVNIGVGKVEVIIGNLAAKILFSEEIFIDPNEVDKDLILDNLVKLINKVIDESIVEKEKILAIGVAMHGVVNGNTGVSLYAPFYKWKDVNIKAQLESRLDLPVFVDNDVRAMALGESLFGFSKDIGNFITINVSNGIGAGIIIDNKPYNGVDFSAGEIGHVIVETNGTRCNCGNLGCLETIASNLSIIKRVTERLSSGEKSSLLEIGKSIENIDIGDIKKAADLGDGLSKESIILAAKYIGIGASNLVNILNPSQIIVVGDIFEGDDFAIKAVNNEINSRALQATNHKVRIIKSKFGKDAAVVGAVTLVIKKIFEGNEVLL